jgi:nitrogen fixation/metabolism regulation signal transduction histidine kinase
VDENIKGLGVRMLKEEELISAVVEKHRRFLEEDRKEFNDLGSRLNQIEEDAKNLKNSRIRMAERKEVLKEKRQQFYHQAEALFEKDLFPKLDQITANKLTEDIKRLKGQIEPEEEQKLKDSFMEYLHGIVRAAGLEESFLLQIQARIDEAMNSNLELKKITESEKHIEEDDGSKNEEISKGKSQHKWLGIKIKNHEEALIYWEKLKV